jgi:hypothetical protein
MKERGRRAMANPGKTFGYKEGTGFGSMGAEINSRGIRARISQKAKGSNRPERVTGSKVKFNIRQYLLTIG